jgi:pimeloyl-ACP methyl ester carboxylesterase
MLFFINGFALGGIICGFLILLLLIVAFICYKIAFYNNKNEIGDFYFPKGDEYQEFKPLMKKLVEEQKKVPFEEIYIKSKDGTKLFGRYYHVKDGAPIQIQFHGYKGSGIRDFCGGNKLSRDVEHNSILVDQRGHGKSDGHTICFGIKEKYDVIDWVNYVIERFGKDSKIILAGVSMGASTILMSSGLKLPNNVVGIIADCPYSSPKEILSKVMKDDMKLPVKLCYPFLYLGGLIFGNLNINESGAEDAVKNSKTPILLIHGKKDTFVPPFMSENIFNNANCYKELHLFDNAEHGISYIVDSEKYSRIVEEFIKKVIN